MKALGIAIGTVISIGTLANTAKAAESWTCKVEVSQHKGTSNDFRWQPGKWRIDGNNLLGPTGDYMGGQPTFFPILKNTPNFVMAMDDGGVGPGGRFEILVLDKKHLTLKNFELWTTSDMQAIGVARCTNL